MAIPIGEEENFEGIVDLVKMKAIILGRSLSRHEFEYGDIPAHLVDVPTNGVKKWLKRC
jgi:elongation factor G